MKAQARFPSWCNFVCLSYVTTSSLSMIATGAPRRLTQVCLHDPNLQEFYTKPSPLKGRMCYKVLEKMSAIEISPTFRPVLDPDFLPASLWNQAFRARVQESGKPDPLNIALERKDGSRSVFRTAVLPHEGANIAANERYVERLLKFLLWQKGGYKVLIAGEARIARFIQGVYSPTGRRAFDFNFMGDRVYGHPMVIERAGHDEVPGEKETAAALGRHLEGCRIGFDLGASDRKSAAVVDGEVVYTEEVPWDPSVQADPQYHFDGIHDSLKRAAAHLPRVQRHTRQQLGDSARKKTERGGMHAQERYALQENQHAKPQA
ncbi:MAG: hypothetical protein M1541_08575 [Acidobacteria bacterium]|nr:hypothetical protein [Acidobacteriota bacterium]